MIKQAMIKSRPSGRIILILLALLPAPALADAQRYIIDPAHSIIFIEVHRAGLMKFLGHEHLIHTQEITGELHYPAAPQKSAQAALTFAVDSLVVDDPQQRQLAGGDYASPVPEDDREGTRKNMLGPKVLDAERFPEVHMSGEWQGGEPGAVQLAIDIRLLDQTRQYTLPAEADITTERIYLNGALQIRQTDFGITPLSAAGGAIKVADALDIRFAFTFVPDADP